MLVLHTRVYGLVLNFHVVQDGCECLFDHSNGTLAIPVLTLLLYCGFYVAGGQVVMLRVSCTARSYVLPLYLYHIGL
jgi:hypothetical protein